MGPVLAGVGWAAQTQMKGSSDHGAISSPHRGQVTPWLPELQVCPGWEINSPGSASCCPGTFVCASGSRCHGGEYGGPPPCSLVSLVSPAAHDGSCEPRPGLLPAAWTSVALRLPGTFGKDWGQVLATATAGLWAEAREAAQCRPAQDGLHLRVTHSACLQCGGREASVGCQGVTWRTSEPPSLAPFRLRRL